MIPETGEPMTLKLFSDTSTTAANGESYLISSPNGVGSAHFENIPQNCRITLEIEPKSENEEYGLYYDHMKKQQAVTGLTFLRTKEL